jgi:hypothetical protein
VRVSNGSTYIFASRPGKEQRRVHRFIDWTWLKNWLQEVPKTVLGGRRPENLTLAIDLEDVRVIDVIEQCVVRLPTNADYVALSYVWGHTPKGALRCEKKNVEDLGKPQALVKANLPLTIADALKVCQQLGFEYLWVDSLCIVQDKSLEKLTQQLDQMANIYSRAMLTLVAAAGNDAAYGLAGVSQARHARQRFFRFHDELELICTAPPLPTCLESSTWATRAWTYQEYIASQRLLFFTGYGLFHNTSFGMNDIASEGASMDAGFFNEDILNLTTVEKFTKRTLTYPTDVLRASAGFLHMIYKDRLLFGMPLDEFDRAILWEPNEFNRRPRQSSDTAIFPSWSWASSSSSVRFLRHSSTLFGLAHYGWKYPSIPDESATSSYEIILPKHGPNQLPGDPNAFICAGLAWSNGCVECEVPPELLVETGNYEYYLPRWRKWHEASDNHHKSSIFDGILESSSFRPGHIVVRAQKTSFLLDLRGQVPSRWSPNTGYVPTLIRANNNKVAGSIQLDDFAAQDLRALNQARALFIALSVNIFSDETPIRPYANYFFSHLSISDFYGCPCALDSDNATNLEHFVECPEHADFWFTDQNSNQNFSVASETDDLAFSHHVTQQSYCDIHGKTIHHAGDPPFL